MGASGGVAPSGLPQRQLKTLFLRAPYQDWPALSQGHKTEFRVPVRGKMADRFHAPTPVVLYAVKSPTHVHKLMVLVEHRVESLLDIDQQPDALRREGFETYEHFRNYWRARTRRPYVPMAKVEVFRLAPWWGVGDVALGEALLERLYGDYL